MKCLGFATNNKQKCTICSDFNFLYLDKRVNKVCARCVKSLNVIQARKKFSPQEGTCLACGTISFTKETECHSGFCNGLVACKKDIKEMKDRVDLRREEGLEKPEKIKFIRPIIVP